MFIPRGIQRISEVDAEKWSNTPGQRHVKHADGLEAAKFLAAYVLHKFEQARAEVYI